MNDRRMIEDFIPVTEVSYESSREKVARRRQGHLSTIHLWWARRPLAACRAAVFATFAPADMRLRVHDPHNVVPDDDQRPEFFTQLCHWTGPVLPPNPALMKAREVVSRAGENGPPRVLDMFAGGGAIPLEAQRLGAKAIAVELNPVAHLIQLCTLDYPMRYGKPLRDAVAKWGHWLVDQVQAEVGDLYPDIEVMEEGQTGELFEGGGPRKLRPIAYFWTRTVPSPARGLEHAQVPLLRQTWLRKKAGGFVALKPEVDRERTSIRYRIVKSKAKTEEEAVREWGFDPADFSARGSTTCPFSGASLGVDDVRIAATGGHLESQFLGMALVAPGLRGKQYLGSRDVSASPVGDQEIAERITRICRESNLSVPDESVPLEDHQSFRTALYGLSTYRDLFTPRQLLTLLTLCKYVRKAHDQCLASTGNTDFATAVASYLTLLVGRVADRGSTLCHWDNTAEKTANTYARQALPMVWDFSEANPFGGASGDARMQLDFILQVIDHAAATAPGNPADVIRGLAQRLPLPDASVDAVITDPPYYDNISYADLSDFFYVWHKRALGPLMPALYGTTLTPKKAEAVVAPYRHEGGREAAAAFYEDQMAEAFVEANRVLKKHGRMVVVYAHKTTLGWSTLIDSLRRARFQVVEAWPLNTEMPDRAGQMNTASLASSIFLVARKRDGGGVGDYAATVRPEMLRIVETRVRELMRLGIGGADLVIAAVGAGLEPFTRFDAVELPSGEELATQRFLEEVQREVLETVLSAVFEVDRSGVGLVDRTSRFYVLARYEYGIGAVDFGEVNVLAQGVGVELAGSGSLSDGKRRLVRQTKSEVRLLDYTDRGAEPTLGLENDGAPAPLVDVLHRLLWLNENDFGKVAYFLQQSQCDLSRLRLLANALKGRALASAGEDRRTSEQKAVDRLLAQWNRLLEPQAVPGRLL